MAVTYVLVAVGMKLGQPLQVNWEDGPPGPAEGVLLVMLFTVSHGVVPVFFYRLFAGPAKFAPIGCFVYAHMGFWFGIPIIGLAALTSWLSLIGVAVHLALARRGTRTWVFLEYGSTSLALALFILVFSGQALFPWGLLVALLQSLLLGLVGTLGRGLWIKDTPTESERSRPQAKTHDLSWAHRRRAATIGIVAGMGPITCFGLGGALAALHIGEWFPLVFIGGFGMVVGAGAGLSTYFGVVKAARHLDRSWTEILAAPYREFAQQVGGTVQMSEPKLMGLIPAMLQSVHFHDRGTDVRLDHHTEGRGDNSTTYLRLNFTLSTKTVFRCHVSSQGFLSKLGTMLGAQDVELGWQLFDDNFVVQASDSTAARQMLTRNVQEHLLRLKLWLRDNEHSEHIDLLIGDTSLVVRLRQFFKRTDEVMKFYEFGRQIHDAFAASGKGRDPAGPSLFQ